MVVKVGPKRQVTLPTRIMEALGVGPGDELELTEGRDGFTLRRRRIELSRLGTLHSKISPGHAPFDIAKFRKQSYDLTFRD